MKKTKSEPSKTVLTITLGFVILFVVTKWRWTLNVSILIGFAGLLSTYLANKIDFVWMKLSYLLSLLLPNIVFSIIFYLVLFPIAMLAKVFGQKDKLMLKNNYKSTFIGTDKSFPKESFEKPW